MAVRNLEAVQQLSGSPVRAESRPGRIGHISLGAKQTGERRAGNPHAAFDVAGTGNVAWSRCCDTRRRKGEKTVNTNFDLLILDKLSYIRREARLVSRRQRRAFCAAGCA